MMPKRPNNDYRDHRGYYREDDDLTVTEGAIQREQKDWSTYRKTDPFILISLAILIATLMGGGIAIGIHFATRGSPNSQVPTSDSHIVPRFAGMNYNAYGFNGTLTHGINSTLSGLATTGTPTLCEDDADETITVTQFLGNNKTASVDTTITTHVQKTLTQTLHKSSMGTTVSSADPVNTTLSGSSVVTQSIPVVTKVLTTSVTETAYHTATAHQSNVASGSSKSSESVIASTSSVEDAPPIVVTTVGPLPSESSHPDVTSVFLTKTLTQTRKTTIQGGPLVSTEEFSSTTTVTPTTIIKSTIYVTAAPLSSTTQAQCSHEIEDHTVYVTVTETFTPGAASSSSSVQSKTSKVSSSKMSSSTASVSPSTATDTILVTYTVTIDSLYPPSTSPIMSSSSSSEKTSSTLVPASKSTIVVTQVATQTIIVSIGHGTTVSSQLGHAGTPIFTSLASSGSAQASTATDVVVLTKTITSNVFKTISASSSASSSSSHSADVQTTTQTSIVTVTASPSSSASTSSKSSSSQSVESILTTIYLTDRATQTVTIGGMATMTVRPEQSSSTSNSTRTETKVITASASRVVRTYTTTVSGQVFTSLITVWKNVTATATATLSGSGSASSLASITHVVQNTTITATATSVIEVPVTLNTTITITGTPMMHPTAPSTLPPFVNGTAMTSSTRHVPTTYHYPTLSSSTATEQPKSTSTVVVVSGAADKHAEGIMGSCKGCTTWLAIFVLGLMVLF
ncbi:uncharacterized protein BDZ83DRAFT_773403 [Colletotrichum acutatum]|uniref:Uncharacterized protein n=1 Tax=Glomerella acutata TaxID=27357 RepID=A0AAD9D342_GLOAC|nr:uncharacterized protein BDZ83DRAFT_773403 [Colletotrichum acutatum]KAK1731290.1 hypothetical protein BDZ83DRAFT_773403 [Colletotrichum acutatum]